MENNEEYVSGIPIHKDEANAEESLLGIFMTNPDVRGWIAENVKEEDFRKVEEEYKPQLQNYKNGLEKMGIMVKEAQLVLP